MTLDEALNELGIDRDADAEGARRAYLRLLKKRKPEVDREGFMRLREAYELAKPYFEQIEMFRAIEKAANEPSSSEDGAPELIRIETPAGVVWVQKNNSLPVQADDLVDREKTTVEQDKPAVEEVKPLVENIDTASARPLEQAPPAEQAPIEETVEPPKKISEPGEVEPPAKEPSAEAPEPSIDELIEAGKFKKAARRMGLEYREAVQQGTMGVPVSAPHQAVVLLLRLHEKNRVEEARALEKDFADWLSATGASVRIMAGPLGVMWMFERELSAVSNKFPPELRQGIAKSVVEGKLDEIQRRAARFQMSDPGKARDAALDLHAHAPTLAKMIADTLTPLAPRNVPAPVRSGNPSGWGIGILLVVFMNLGRLFFSSESSSPTSYHGQDDRRSNYRPLPPPSPDSYAKSESSSKLVNYDGGPPADDDVKMDQATRDKLVKLAQSIETAAAKANKLEERWIIQRARNVRSALETGSCNRASAELNGFATDMFVLSDSLKAALLPNAKKLDQMLTTACTKKNTSKTPKDGGTKKP